ncbi:MAG: class I SAM-dependent methyltransferase [Verrucomicrobiota bacterium]|jgi:cyclopropane fatty-acyl-phospholipid synthase-like methyltransferase
MKSSSAYEKVYSAEAPYFPTDPLPQLLQILRQLASPAKCLDLGCGEGRDAMVIASHGHNVTAIDFSLKASAFLRAEAKRRRLKVSVLRSDARKLRLPKSAYEFVYARTLLDHITYQDAVNLAKKVYFTLKPEGLLLIEVFSMRDPGNRRRYLPSSELVNWVKHYYDEGELLGLFPKMQFLSLDRCLKYDDTHGEPHFHETLILRARKSTAGWQIGRLVDYV